MVLLPLRAAPLIYSMFCLFTGIHFDILTSSLERKDDSPSVNSTSEHLLDSFEEAVPETQNHSDILESLDEPELDLGAEMHHLQQLGIEDGAGDGEGDGEGSDIEEDEQTLDSLRLAQEASLRQENAESLAAQALLGEGQTDLTSSPTTAGDETEDPSPGICLEDMHISSRFISLLRNASIEGDSVSDKVKARLRNPKAGVIDVAQNHAVLLGMEIFQAVPRRDAYEAVRRAISRHTPPVIIPSFNSLKTSIRELTGVTSIRCDMCINSCIAYAGPFANEERCPKCQEPRYDAIQLQKSGGKTKTPRQEFHTIPIGPVIQAIHRSLEGATLFQHRFKRTIDIFRELTQTRTTRPQIFDDIYCSETFLNAIRKGNINENDTVLMFSIDGAQLYAHKQSDTWIWIWIFLDLPPEIRYKKRFVIPAAIIPGPKKPKNIESFMFLGLYHLAALQNDGFRVWNALKKESVIDRPWLHLGGGDGPGAGQVSGLVPHHGSRGCRMHCNVIGRHKPNCPTYYPVLLKPNSYDVEGCNHEDFDASSVCVVTPQQYNEELIYLMTSPSDTQFKNRRKESGICKPSIIMGLHRRPEILDLFPSDIMHHASLNLTDLHINLWRGTIDCQADDDISTWDFSVLTGDVWIAHGKEVAYSTPFLPGSFGDGPRNIAEKVSSGYKASEFQTWFYILGPALLYKILPLKYWQNFCKLVMAMRIAHQHSISLDQVKLIDRLLISFHTQFEQLYYQRKISRLHFVRQCVHLTLHTGPDILRSGPHCYYAQWTMERTIGNLGEEIRQPSNPYANLSQRAIIRAQTNSLQAACPELAREVTIFPRGSIDIGRGYVLLCARDHEPMLLQDILDPTAAKVIQDFWNINQTPSTRINDIVIARWARLRLPNGQIARSRWKESQKPLEKIRIARNIKVRIHFSAFPTIS